MQILQNYGFYLRSSVLGFSLLSACLWLGGCASVFDDPYEDIEAVPLARSESEIELVDLDPPVAAQPARPRKDYPDIWARIREGFAVDAFVGDKTVDRVARRLAADGTIERIAQRSAGHLHYVVEATSQQNLPMEVVLVPFVESGYSLSAASFAEAHGAWQFIEGTARNYEIRIDRFRDDRRNLIVSTRAALNYLTTLHGMFSDWPLAMAAYNCGEKRVAAEIEKLRRKGIERPGFLDIAPALPQETRDYVPRIFAVKQLIANPQAYRARLPEIADAPLYSVVEVHRDIDVALLARLAGFRKVEELLRLNPSLTAPVILGRQNVQLLLPHQAALDLSRNMAAHPGPWISWRLVRITRATSPAEVARRSRITVARVLQANPLPDGHFYEPGSTLILPGSAQDAFDAGLAERAVLLTRAASECITVQSCIGEGEKAVPPATINGLPRR